MFFHLIFVYVACAVVWFTFRAFEFLLKGGKGRRRHDMTKPSEANMTVVEDLIPLLERCQEDTRRLLGPGASKRLGNWRRHDTDERKLIEYVQKLLWGAHCQNGKKLDQQKQIGRAHV